MRLLLDENIGSSLLETLLVKDGHDVSTPSTAGTLGDSDASQLTNAILDDRVILSYDYEDFDNLHVLVRTAGGRHHGSLVIRRDNDPTRDLTAKGIVSAIRKLQAAGVAIENDYIVLNHWR